MTSGKKFTFDFFEIAENVMISYLLNS